MIGMRVNSLMTATQGLRLSGSGRTRLQTNISGVSY